MRRMICGVMMVAGLMLGVSGTGWAQATPLEAAKTFVAAFDAGDMAKAASMMSPNGLTIVDEFAPFYWTGKTAFADWGASFDKDAKVEGLTAPSVSMGAPLVNTVSGDFAYLIVPMTYSYKAKGVAMREPARVAMVMHKEGGVWRFISWTWTGTVPKVAK